jgi:hypothetical protein
MQGIMGEDSTERVSSSCTQFRGQGEEELNLDLELVMRWDSDSVWMLTKGGTVIIACSREHAASTVCNHEREETNWMFSTFENDG